MGELRDAVQSTLEEAKSTATEKVEETKDQAAGEIARTAQGSKPLPRRWKARPFSKTCFAKPRMA